MTLALRFFFFPFPQNIWRKIARLFVFVFRDRKKTHHLKILDFLLYISLTITEDGLVSACASDYLHLQEFVIFLDGFREPSLLTHPFSTVINYIYQ